MSAIELTDLNRALWNAGQQLKADAKYLKELAQDKAESERKYKKALAKIIMRLKDQKMPATLINDLARGDDEVANLRFYRDLARVQYDTAKSCMRSAEVQVSAIQSILRYQDKMP